MSEVKEVNPPKFIQITSFCDADGEVHLYALDSEGEVYVKSGFGKEAKWFKINNERFSK